LCAASVAGAHAQGVAAQSQHAPQLALFDRVLNLDHLSTSSNRASEATANARLGLTQFLLGRCPDGVLSWIVQLPRLLPHKCRVAPPEPPMVTLIHHPLQPIGPLCTICLLIFDLSWPITPPNLAGPSNEPRNCREWFRLCAARDRREIEISYVAPWHSIKPR
jgi:hypothetical protein